MQQKKDYTLLALFIPFMFALIASGFFDCKKIEIDKQTGHKCRWQFCPYKGVLNNQYGKAVAAYTGTDGGDAYSIDILHLEFPAKEYDELEQMLFED